MNEWKEYRFSYLMQLYGGGTPKTSVSAYWGGDIPWLSVTDFNNGKKYCFDAEKKITEKGLKESSTKILKQGQIIISARGTVGVVSMLGRDMAFNQSNYGIDANKEITSNDFLYYLLKSKVSDFISNSYGAVFNTITKDTFEQIYVSVPPIQEQKAIASILSSLDDKIDLLQRKNKTLEQLAETLFRQWFLEEASEDSEVKTIADIANIYNGKSRPNEIGTIPIYGGNGILGYTNTSNYRDKSIIIGRVGAYCGSVYYENKEIWVSDNALLMKSKNEILIHYLFYFLKSIDLNLMAEGSSHPLLTQTLLKSIELDFPPDSKLKNFYYSVEQWRNKIQKNNNQINTLLQLRDLLLPKLMSGEVRVKM